MYKQMVALKQQNPDLKVMLAVGGWNHGAAPFTQMVATEQSRAEFVENSYNFLKQHGFDGLDLGKYYILIIVIAYGLFLDWEYPADRGSPPEDRHRFTQLAEVIINKILKKKSFLFL